MHGAHALLVVLLVVNAAQAVAAVAAFTQGGVRRRRGDDLLARYSRGHAWLLLAASAVLSVPPVLGLTGVVSTRLAVWVTIAGEVAAFSLARRRLPRLHAEAHDSPGAAAPAPATAASPSAASEGTSEAAEP